jgi:hypothetical protein
LPSSDYLKTAKVQKKDEKNGKEYILAQKYDNKTEIMYLCKEF